MTDEDARAVRRAASFLERPAAVGAELADRGVRRRAPGGHQLALHVARQIGRHGGADERAVAARQLLREVGRRAGRRRRGVRAAADAEDARQQGHEENPRPISDGTHATRFMQASLRRASASRPESRRRLRGLGTPARASAAARKGRIGRSGVGSITRSASVRCVEQLVLTSGQRMRLLLAHGRHSRTTGPQHFALAVDRPSSNLLYDYCVSRREVRASNASRRATPLAGHGCLRT